MADSALVVALVSGVVLGSLYALMASGLSLVWSTLRVFNFAHGAFIMAGAYFAWSLSELEIPISSPAILTLVIMIGAVVLTGLLGIVAERLLLRPLLGDDNAVLMVSITTIAGSMFLVNAAQLIFGPRVKQLPRIATGTVEVLGVVIGVQDVLIIVVAPIVLLVFAAILKWTRVGAAVRAVEENRDLAQLVGIRPKQVYALTMAFSAGLGGFAGVLLGSILVVTPTMGDDPLLRAFVVVVVGGLGSLPGTVIGAYFVGILEAMSIAVVGLYWAPVVLFVVLIAMLAWRPTGLMGRAE